MLHTKFPCVEIGSLVPEKKILKGFTIYLQGGNFGQMISIMLINVYFYISKNLHTKFR